MQDASDALLFYIWMIVLCEGSSHCFMESDVLLLVGKVQLKKPMDDLGVGLKAESPRWKWHLALIFYRIERNTVGCLHNMYNTDTSTQVVLCLLYFHFTLTTCTHNILKTQFKHHLQGFFFQLILASIQYQHLWQPQVLAGWHQATQGQWKCLAS